MHHHDTFAGMHVQEEDVGEVVEVLITMTSHKLKEAPAK
jgi:hypothetical protein